MNNGIKSIVHAGISFRRGEFRNDSTMTEKLPKKLKNRILEYLRTPPAGLIGDVALIDPVTGNCYNHTSIVRENDGFEWSTATIYMLEHYDIKLSEEFLKLFK